MKAEKINLRDLVEEIPAHRPRGKHGFRMEGGAVRGIVTGFDRDDFGRDFVLVRAMNGVECRIQRSKVRPVG